ncbi:XRE family transcriptional regulator [Bordetella petrii]|uniref:XRE family transcriptional regulator n=1 Tax=Bordetella petrii TaxID=94624 RepID=UPI001E40B0F0|nr:XRE family transcriptional regulator [Bordetella petrii]MCD0502334.1 XRE family transcriptional regulator [Bordetella petrii]
MEESTSRAATPGTPARGAPSGWRHLWLRVNNFLEAIGEVLHGMDEARNMHPTISAFRDPRR